MSSSLFLLAALLGLYALQPAQCLRVLDIDGWVDFKGAAAATAAALSTAPVPPPGNQTCKGPPWTILTEAALKSANAMWADSCKLNDSTTQPGQNCSVICLRGYQPASTAYGAAVVATCQQNGNWTPNPAMAPNCVPMPGSCKGPPNSTFILPPNATWADSCTSENSITPPGQTCNVTCLPGFKQTAILAAGEATWGPTCQNGNWTPAAAPATAPNCAPDTQVVPVPPTPPGCPSSLTDELKSQQPNYTDPVLACTDGYNEGSVCSATCAPGYETDPALFWNLTCQNGAWKKVVQGNPESLCTAVPTSEPGAEPGVNPGAIAGAVIASVVGVVIIAAVVLFLVKKHKRGRGTQFIKDPHSLQYAPRPTNSRQFPMTYLPPADNRLMLPSSGPGPLVAGFTLDQLKTALSDNVTAVNLFVRNSLRSTGSSGAVRDWLLDGLAQQRLAINSRYRDSDRLTEDWAKHSVWKWLALDVWGDRQLLMALQATDPSTARKVLATIKRESRRDPNQPTDFVQTCNTLKHRLLQKITQRPGSSMANPFQPGGSGYDLTNCDGLIMEVIKSALLLRLQALGTSGGMQLFVPGATPGNGQCTVNYDDYGVTQATRMTVLCSKPGVLDTTTRDQNATAIPAQATRYG